MAVYTYDPREVLVIVGAAEIGGYTDGSFVKVARDEDAYSKVVGADGQVSRARNANRTGSVTITLKQTSASNDALSILAAADEVGNAGVVPLVIKDLMGTTAVATAECWVKKLPDMDFAKEVSDREWVIDCGLLEIYVGGNTIS